MVLDLGKDHYHLQGEALNALGEKVRHGNMEDVLKVYEAEMKASRYAPCARPTFVYLFLIHSLRLKML
jgi:hypothetical protein